MKVLELLDNEEKWTKGWYARDESGEPVASFDPDAVQWCMSGALIECYPNERERQIARDRLRDFCEIDIEVFNDTHTFADIRRVLELANI